MLLDNVAAVDSQLIANDRPSTLPTLQADHGLQSKPVHPKAERVQTALAALGVEARVVELGESTRTSAEAAQAIGTSVAQIAKSLVFMPEEIDDPVVLVIASGANRVSVEKVAKKVGRRLTLADADEVRIMTGYAIGGVPPVGHKTKLRVLIDQDLLPYGEVWAAAGTPKAVFPTSGQELARITGGEVADVRED